MGYSSWQIPAARFMRRARYPRLSEAVAGGLYHYGCKCWHVSYFKGVTPTDYRGESIPSFVDHKTSNQVLAELQDDVCPDTDPWEERMQNYARLVEAATLLREAKMGNIVNLGEWFENSLSYLRERYTNVSGTMERMPGTNTISVRLSANGRSGYAQFRDGVNGTRIGAGGNIFVDPQLLWNAFGRVIDPPIIHTPVMDSVRFGLGVGAARGVGRVVSWLDRIASNSNSTSNKWANPDGSVIWPGNNGFDGTPTTKTLQPGTRISRYGSEAGRFVSPEGTSLTQRALPPGSNSRPYHVYEVVKPVQVQSGRIAPWFGESGGGTQHMFNRTIEDLIRSGVLGGYSNVGIYENRH